MMSEQAWTPTVATAFIPPRRRRRWPWVLGVVLVVIVGLLVAVDRIAVSVAEDRIADRLTDESPFIGRPDVSINGFPFLTQAARGTYTDIVVSGKGEPVGRLGPVDVVTRLHGVHLSLADATSHVSSVPVDRGEITVSVTLAALAHASGIEGLTLTADGDEITARGPVEIPGFGEVTVTATGRLLVNSAGDVTVDLQSFEGVEVKLPSSVQSVVRKALGLIVPVDDLPFDAVAASVRVDGDTVLVTGTATNIVLE